jgi:hypothetical protein
VLIDSLAGSFTITPSQGISYLSRQTNMFHDPRTGKRRSRRHDAATLPARVPIAHILIFSSPSNRDRLRVVSPHWNNSEKASRQHYYHPLVVDKCPVTKTTFNPKIDYRKRFIGLAKIEVRNKQHRRLALKRSLMYKLPIRHCSNSMNGTPF